MIAGAVLLIGSGAAHAEDEEQGFELKLADSIDLEVETLATTSLTLQPRSGYSVSHDGPILIELTAEDGVALPKARYRRSDAADPAADAPRFELRLRGVRAGEHRVEVRVRFWLCRRYTCRPYDERRSLRAVTRAKADEAG